MNSVTARRWDALDVLRGLTIMLMLLYIAPGSWAHNFGFLVHAPWEGWTLIDMVAPAFLFCIGVAMPLSFERRSISIRHRADSGCPATHSPVLPALRPVRTPYRASNG